MLTCDLSCRDALSCCVAGGHFSGARVKVAQLAVEFSGVAELNTARSRHIVNGVMSGKHRLVPGEHSRLSVTRVCYILWSARDCGRGEEEEMPLKAIEHTCFIHNIPLLFLLRPQLALSLI